MSKHYSIKVIVDTKICPCVSQNKDLFWDVLAFMEGKALKITSLRGYLFIFYFNIYFFPPNCHITLPIIIGYKLTGGG